MAAWNSMGAEALPYPKTVYALTPSTKDEKACIPAPSNCSPFCLTAPLATDVPSLPSCRNQLSNFVLHDATRHRCTFSFILVAALVATSALALAAFIATPAPFLTVSFATSELLWSVFFATTAPF